MSKRDYYEVLGVNKNSSEAEIKSAFRKISMKYHPDRQNGKTDAEKKAAEEKFKEAAEAYEVLSDKTKRQQYDQFGFQEQGGFGNFHSNFNPSDIFNMFNAHFGGGFGFDPFNTARQSRRDTSNDPEDGCDVQMQIEITFKDSVFGVTKEFDLNLEEQCSECSGTGIAKGSTPKECAYCHGTGMMTSQRGMMIMQQTCPHCHGQGRETTHCSKCHGLKRVSAKKHVKLNIPAGIKDGQRLVLQGKGQCGIKGGKNGDMYVVIVVQHSDVFERQNSLDLKLRLPISPIVASIGGEVDVMTMYGSTKLKVPAETAAGTILKIDKAGIRSKDATGDMIVEIAIEPIADLTDAQKKILADFAAGLTSKNFKQHQVLKKAFNNMT